MRNIIKTITITILIGAGLLVVNAQQTTVALANEGSTGKVEKEKETAKKQAAADDDSWTGFYIGGFGGYANARAGANASTIYVVPGHFNQQSLPEIAAVGAQRIRSNGFNAGGTVGYNYQTGRFFVGGEFDFGANRVSGSSRATGTYTTFLPLDYTVEHTVKSDWMLTARHRGGVASKKMLLYVTGGIALTNLKYAGSFDDEYGANGRGSLRKTRAGWTAGAGMEFRIARRWSVKGEYLFSQFARTSMHSSDFLRPGNVSAPDQIFTYSTDLKSHNLRFGVNYRF